MIDVLYSAWQLILYSIPINLFVGKLKNHVNEISNCWDIIENSYC